MNNPKDIDQFGQFTVDIWFSGGGGDTKDEKSLSIMSLGLAGESGEVLEHIKKLIRDGNLNRDALKKELGDVAYYWARICRYFDFQPSEIINANVEKLESRKARGVMRGDGDNR